MVVYTQWCPLNRSGLLNPSHEAEHRLGSRRGAEARHTPTCLGRDTVGACRCRTSVCNEHTRTLLLVLKGRSESLKARGSCNKHAIHKCWPQKETEAPGPHSLSTGKITCASHTAWDHSRAPHTHRQKPSQEVRTQTVCKCSIGICHQSGAVCRAGIAGSRHAISAGRTNRKHALHTVAEQHSTQGTYDHHASASIERECATD